MTGAESPEAVRKLMSLSDKVRPHNSKHNPLPPKSVLMATKSPRVGRRPPSPRQQRPAAAVSLSVEDSSLVSLSSRPASASSATSGAGAAASKKVAVVAAGKPSESSTGAKTCSSRNLLLHVHTCRRTCISDYVCTCTYMQACMSVL